MALFWHIWNILSVVEGDLDKFCFTDKWRCTPPCRTWPRDESNGESLLGNYIYLLDFSYHILGCKINLLHFLTHLEFFLWSAVECDTHKFFIPPYRTWPRDESNGKSLLGNYIYLLDFSYDTRWSKVKLLHFFDTFGIFSLQWQRVTRTSLLYSRVGHGPGMNRTEKVS